MLNPNHPRYQTRERVRGWNCPVSPMHVPRLLARRVDWTREERHALAAEFEEAAKHAAFIYSELLDLAALETFGRLFWPTDYRISGIGCLEFAERFKPALRFWVWRIGNCKGVANTLRKVRGQGRRVQCD